MTTLLNPWIMLAGLLALLASFGGGYAKGRIDAESNQVRDELLIQQAAQAAQSATAELIANIKIKNTTIKQEIQREILEKPVYRDCRHDAVGVQLINSALDGAKPVNGIKLPQVVGATPR